jgi:hypothetical protein
VSPEFDLASSASMTLCIIHILFTTAKAHVSWMALARYDFSGQKFPWVDRATWAATCACVASIRFHLFATLAAICR